MIRFVCECGKQLQAREENAGKLARCPACDRQLTVPAEPPPSDAVQVEEPVVPEESVQPERPILRDERELEEEQAITDRPRRRQPAGNSGKAVASLVLGILSLFCNFLAGLPALILGLLALRDISRSRGRLSGQGLAIAGITTACVLSFLNCGLMLPALLLPAVQRVREAANRAQSQNNLAKMGFALLNYTVTNGTLPLVDSAVPPRLKRAGQKPLLSWRVAILPFIEQQRLYNQFKLDEPWNSPHNITLVPQMPKVYNCPGVQVPPGHTVYQVFVGNGAAFEKTGPTNIPVDFPDGTSNTILIVEAAQAVPWTKPEDLDFDPQKPIKPLLASHYRGGFLAAMADGSVRFVTSGVPENTLKAAITRNGREALGPDW